MKCTAQLLFATIVLSSSVAATPAAAAGTTPMSTLHSNSHLESPYYDIRATSREERPFSLSFLTGWNALAGTGLQASFNLSTHWALDTGAGLSAGGPRAGAQVRYNLLASNLTPFVAAGVQASTGFSATLSSDNTGPTRDGLDRLGATDRSDDGPSFRYRVLPTLATVPTLGVTYQSWGGFAFSAAAGYAFNLTGKTYKVTEGAVTEKQLQATNIILGDGPVLALSLGHAF